MKITKKTLKKIIKEEIETLNENQKRIRLGSLTLGEVAVIARALEAAIDYGAENERITNAMQEVVTKVSEEAAAATGMGSEDIQYMDDEELGDLLGGGYDSSPAY